MKLPETIWKPLYGDIARTVFTVIAIAGVLILLIAQQNTANRQAKNNHQLLINQQKIVSQLKGAVLSLETNNDMKLTDLQNHIDCIVNYFNTPGRTGNTTIDSNTCNINNPVTGSPVSISPKVLGVASPKPSAPVTVTPVTQLSMSSPSPSLSPPSSLSLSLIPKPGIIKQILNFLGL